MISRQKNMLSRILVPICFMVAATALCLSGCAHSPNTINPAVIGPQLVVNPDAVRLGVANLMGTDIVFEGSGFQPDDSVFINMLGPDSTEVTVASGKVQPDGTFTANINSLAKVMDILRADIVMDYSERAKYGQTLLITRDPIPAGAYTATATGLLSDKTAETTLTIDGPSRIDRLKDWIGKKLGKIQDKRT